MSENMKLFALDGSGNADEYGSVGASRDCGDKKTIDRSERQHSTTNCEAFMHLMRSSVAMSILAIPNGVLSAGLWVGFVGTLFVGACVTYCMHILVQSCHRVYARTDHVTLDYGELMEKALEIGPEKLRPASKFGRAAVNFFLLLSQLGLCSVYIVFISSNVKHIIHGQYEHDPDVRLYMVVLFLLLVPYVLIRHLDFMALFSGIANVLMLACLIIIFQYIVQDLPPVSSRPAYNSTQYLPLFLGTALYVCECIGTLLPIENSMATPEDLLGWTGVLNLAMIISICMFAAMGFYGYLKFGDTVQGSITLNLPANSGLYRSVDIMYAVVVFVTFGLQYYVAFNVLWPTFLEKLRTTNHVTLVENVFRITLLGLASCIAMVVPHLDLLISLVGSLAMSNLAIIFPAFIDMLVMSADDTLSVRLIIVDVLLCVFGIITSISGTIVSLVAIIQRF